MCADRDVVMEAVRHPRVASRAGVEIEGLLRCRQNGLALEFACEKLRADRELVRTACCQERERERECLRDMASDRIVAFASLIGCMSGRPCAGTGFCSFARRSRGQACS